MNIKLLEPEFIKIKSELAKKLEAMSHPDSTRVAREILEFICERSPECTPEKAALKAKSILKRLHENEPWEYIRGWAEFCGNRYLVDSNVLIPRPETEQLAEISVQKLVDYAKKNPKASINVIDVGTGSGCIITSIAGRAQSLLPSLSLSARFFGTDINPKSLKIAKKNAKKLEVEIEFIETNLIEEMADYFKEHKEDTYFFVANLPYIPSEVCGKLDKSVLEYEPLIALDGGETGVHYYEQLLAQLQEHEIKPEFMIWEIDPLIEKKILEMAPNSELIKDYSNKNRFIA